MKYIYLASAAIVAIGALVYFVYRRQQKITVLNEEVLDDELKFDSVLSFFKLLQLDKTVDIPFIANADCKEFREMFHAPYPKAKDGYVSLFIGVYNVNTNQIIQNKLIHAKSLEDKILSILGSENLIVLK